MSKTNTRTEIIQNMARAYYESSYMDWVEEYPDMEEGEGCGVDPECVWYAFSLADELEKQHGKHLAEIFADAVAISVANNAGGRPRNEEMFGHYAAMEHMGHGVGLWDALGQEACKFVNVPYGEFSYLDMDPKRFPTSAEDLAS